ncbi:helix-turn-helix domain-containing protein [Dasania marina]|uniref:helix-turn-helix domain-containing protein n=1 Tax=Dasania marina TaxID=471499 RepID=UPI00036D6E33|nr:helix-turn-helix domain-containing protein [Dasania marina]
MKKTPTNDSIPVFKLYGGDHEWLTPDLLHCERIADRSKLHAWEIKPHRHSDLLQIFYIQTGEACIQLDDSQHTLTPPVLLLVAEMCVHGFNFSSDTEGYVLTLASPLVNQLHTRLGAQQSLLKESAYYAVAHEQGYFDHLFEQINQEYRAHLPGRELLLDALVGNIIVSTSRIAIKTSAPAKTQQDKGLEHYSQFSQLLEQQYKSHLSIEAYAEQLNITGAHLNALCRRIAKQSALQIIHERLLLEAKRNLIYTAMTISEISNELGFSEPAYFTRFFKRHCDISPKNFRQKSGTTTV